MSTRTIYPVLDLSVEYCCFFFLRDIVVSSFTSDLVYPLYQLAKWSSSFAVHLIGYPCLTGSPDALAYVLVSYLHVLLLITYGLVLTTSDVKGAKKCLPSCTDESVLSVKEDHGKTTFVIY